MQKRIWITWETQRRSIELSKKLRCKLFIIEYFGKLRYPRSIWKTLVILKREQPDILFVQNPSMILATVACIYKLFTRKLVVIDRHTTFRLNKEDTLTPYNIIHKILNRFTLQFSDLTVVTNNYLAKLVREKKGNSFVLPDMIPNLFQTEPIYYKHKNNILFITSFANDEPIAEVFNAMKGLEKHDICLYVTGNSKKLDPKLNEAVPPNIVLTGFLEENHFINMLFSVDAIMVLTTADCTMLCGCYEAISVGKPLITSDKVVLRDYFQDAVFVNNTKEGISEGIMKVMEDIDCHKDKIITMGFKLRNEWEALFNNLEKNLDELYEKT